MRHAIRAIELRVVLASCEIETPKGQRHSDLAGKRHGGLPIPILFSSARRSIAICAEKHTCRNLQGFHEFEGWPKTRLDRRKSPWDWRDGGFTADNRLAVVEREADAEADEGEAAEAAQEQREAGPAGEAAGGPVAGEDQGGLVEQAQQRGVEQQRGEGGGAGAGVEEEREEGDEEQHGLRVGEADGEGLPEAGPGAGRAPRRGGLTRRAQQLQADPAQVGDAGRLQGAEDAGMEREQRGEAEHGAEHPERVAGEGAGDGGHAAPDAVAPGGGEDGQRARPGDQLEDQDRGDEFGIVLDAGHRARFRRLRAWLRPRP